MAPAIDSLNQTRCVYPIDADAGGTWLLVNEFGLTLGLLNYYEAQVSYTPKDRLSRGKLPINMAGFQTLAEVHGAFEKEDLAPYPPFHFLAVDPSAAALLITWDGHQITMAGPKWDDLPITTSSFQTKQVVAARKTLFKKEVHSAVDTVKAMETYHCQKKPEPPTFGVIMTRQNAKTVSVSRVQVTDSQISMSYRARPGDDAELLAAETVSIARI